MGIGRKYFSDNAVLNSIGEKGGSKKTNNESEVTQKYNRNNHKTEPINHQTEPINHQTNQYVKYEMPKKYRKIRKLRMKNDSYGSKIIHSNGRSKIRSLPRHMSKKRHLRAQLNKSMIETGQDLPDARGIILAMSRRTKQKSKYSPINHNIYRIYRWSDHEA